MKTKLKKDKIIVIDPGHGGHDPGATNGDYQEKIEALSLSLELRDRLINQGYQVVLTRSKDEFIELKERANIANKIGSNIFISIHLNSFSNVEAQGLEVFHFPASVEGNKLSVAIYNQLTMDKLYTKKRGIKSANFAVLEHSKMPSCLIETVFISNQEDLKMLLNKREDFAKSICKGIMTYLKDDYMEVEDMKNENTPSDWAKEDWEMATKLKITDGTNPKKLCTREETITMIARAIKNMK